MQACLLMLLPWPALLACVNQRERSKRDDRSSSCRPPRGEYTNDAGERAVIAPVYVAHDRPRHHLLERSTANGTVRPAAGARAIGATARRSCSSRYAFTQQSQWRNLREHPELLSALQPQRRAARRHLRHQARQKT